MPLVLRSSTDLRHLFQRHRLLILKGKEITAGEPPPQRAQIQKPIQVLDVLSTMPQVIVKLTYQTTTSTAASWSCQASAASSLLAATNQPNLSLLTASYRRLALKPRCHQIPALTPPHPSSVESARLWTNGTPTIALPSARLPQLLMAPSIGSAQCISSPTLTVLSLAPSGL
jgi:hypothetical protein